MQRRDALVSLGTLAALAPLAGAVGETRAQPAGAAPGSGTGKGAALPGWDEAKGEYVLPALPYGVKDLEPHLDAATMEVHHGAHHAAYVAGANKALVELRRIREGGDAGLVRAWSRELAFHLGGHVNHALFWQCMAPAGKGGGGTPGGALAATIERDFSSHEKFVAHFKAAAIQVEGGGWAWLVLEPMSQRLLVMQQEKQQDLMPGGAIPLLGVDVWEHAYYLKYKNKRSAYVDAWMNVVNWSFVQARFDALRGPDRTKP